MRKVAIFEHCNQISDVAWRRCVCMVQNIIKPDFRLRGIHAAHGHLSYVQGARLCHVHFKAQKYHSPVCTRLFRSCGHQDGLGTAAARLPVMYSTGVILKPMSLFWLWILLRHLFFRDTKMGRVEPVCTLLQTAGLRNVGLLVSLGVQGLGLGFNIGISVKNPQTEPSASQSLMQDLDSKNPSCKPSKFASKFLCHVPRQCSLPFDSPLLG